VGSASPPRRTYLPGLAAPSLGRTLPLGWAWLGLAGLGVARQPHHALLACRLNLAVPRWAWLESAATPHFAACCRATPVGWAWLGWAWVRSASEFTHLPPRRTHTEIAQFSRARSCREPASPCLSAGLDWAQLGLGWAQLASPPCPASPCRALPLGWAWLGSAGLGWAWWPRRALPRPAVPCFSAELGWLDSSGLGWASATPPCPASSCRALPLGWAWLGSAAPPCPASSCRALPLGWAWARLVWAWLGIPAVPCLVLPHPASRLSLG